MFILRSIKEEDLQDVFNLATLVQFINLPPSRDVIKQKISASRLSFKRPSSELYKNYYIFVLEDVEAKKIVGSSMIHAQHGTETEPHFFLSVGQEKKFSDTINTGFIHGTLRLGLNTDGPTEIGGLVLHPDYRKNNHKLGKQLSFVRFLYMAMYPDRFKAEIHAELMPPLDGKGNSPLWEAIGRRFMNMDYQEADKLSITNKEFILNLFPRETIYETLLPLDARNAIGKVGEDTKPVKAMLEKIGFKYTQEVDPFDGGPHYRCPLKDIKPVKNLLKGTLHVDKKQFKDKPTKSYLISILNDSYEFYAFRSQCHVVKDISGTQVFLDPEVANQLNIKNSQECHAILLNWK